MQLDHLVEQQVLSHGARIRHRDEEREQRRGPAMHPPEKGELAAQFQALHLEQDLLSDYLEERKCRERLNREQIRREEAGPMFIWEALAEQLYRMVA